METKIKISLIIIMIHFSTVIGATDKYLGGIFVDVIEKDGSTYRGDNFKPDTLTRAPFDGKKVIYLEQVTGQKVSLAPRNVLIDSSKDVRYHFTIDIRENRDDIYKATVKLFLNTAELDKEGNYNLVSNEIKSEEIRGQLNSKNRYVFIDDGKPNLKLTLEIDKVFSEEEMLEIMRRKNQKNNLN